MTSLRKQLQVRTMEEDFINHLLLTKDTILEWEQLLPWSSLINTRSSLTKIQ